MLIAPRAWMILPLLAASNCGSAFSQQLAFTSRTYIQSPIVITSTESSKEFGFDSVVIRNDGPHPISAIHFQIVFRSGAEDEIAGERRVAVSLEPRDTKRLIVDLAHIEGLKQQAKSRKQPSALVILTIESVEFEDGGVWNQTERDRGITIDPVNAPREMSPRK